MNANISEYERKYDVNHQYTSTTDSDDESSFLLKTLCAYKCGKLACKGSALCEDCRWLA